MSDLTPDLHSALDPLLGHLPPYEAMAQLVVHEPADPQAVALVEQVLRHPALKGKPALAAALWLYVDDLDRSHTISQQIEDATGSYLHGIMHRREGDFANSHYWFRKAGKHPAMGDVASGYDPHRFIDDVEAAVAAGNRREDLVELQRAEWAALFKWMTRKA
jgi:hypothetical protein